MINFQRLEYCFDSGYDYPGADIGNAGASSAFDCQTQCLKFSGCKFFTFDMSAKRCYFKNAQANRNKKTITISGPSKCYDGEYFSNRSLLLLSLYR